MNGTIAEVSVWPGIGLVTTLAFELEVHRYSRRRLCIAHPVQVIDVVNDHSPVSDREFDQCAQHEARFVRVRRRWRSG